MSNPQKLSPNFLIHYVADVAASVRIYQDLLGMPPIQASPGFALFALQNGMNFGLWRKDTVLPALSEGSGHEISFPATSRDHVNALFEDWRDKGWPIVQTPTDMDFGFTFTALDPDGHRLRVMVPNA